MKKIAGIIIAILVLVVLASGCTSSSNSTSGSSSNVTVQIISNNAWAGDISYTNGDMQINGTGNATYNLGANPGHVVVGLQNTGNGNLTVQLLQGGNVVEMQSTSENMGFVKIDHKY
jgi:ABC-type Fe3+-hydroxamate transport system substrate-binding protein